VTASTPDVPVSRTVAVPAPKPTATKHADPKPDPAPPVDQHSATPRDHQPATVTVVEPSKPAAKPRKPRVAVTTTKPPDPAPPPPAVDPKLGELTAARRALDQEWRKRELLASDLPAAYSSAVQAVDAALAAKDSGAATQAIERAHHALAGIAIDRAFIDHKLQRINARIQKLPPDRLQVHKDLLRDVVAAFNRSDYSGANRKLNQIAAHLNVGP
jgi:hypothetical protein